MVWKQTVAGFETRIHDVDHVPPHCPTGPGRNDAQVDLHALRIINPPPHWLLPNMRLRLLELRPEPLEAWERRSPHLEPGRRPMALVTASSTVFVDYSGIGSMKVRYRVRPQVGSLGLAGRDLTTGFWATFLEPGPEPTATDRTLVIGDLTRIVLHFRACDRPTWVAPVRKASPYFLALIRTRSDRRSVPLIDNLMRSCDQRLCVCGDPDAATAMEACIHEALAALDPESLTDVRHSSATDSFWIQFAVGLSGSISLAELRINDLRDELVVEPAIPGDQGAVMTLTRKDGSPFEIDSASLQSALDSESSRRRQDAAHESSSTVGARVRAAHKSAGITQHELDRRTGLDQAVISNLETGKHDPRAGTLCRLAQAPDLSLAGPPGRR